MIISPPMFAARLLLWIGLNCLWLIFTGAFRADRGGIEGGQRSSGGAGPKFCGRSGGPTTVGNLEKPSSTTVGGTERPAAEQVITEPTKILLIKKNKNEK